VQVDYQTPGEGVVAGARVAVREVHREQTMGDRAVKRIVGFMSIREQRVEQPAQVVEQRVVQHQTERVQTEQRVFMGLVPARVEAVEQQPDCKQVVQVARVLADPAAAAAGNAERVLSIVMAVTAVTDSQSLQRCATHEIRNHSIKHSSERDRVGRRSRMATAIRLRVNRSLD
jgi:hypothetical protein